MAVDLYINVPIGALAVFMASQFLHDPAYFARQRATNIDGIGIGLLVVGLASLQTVLSEGQNDDWFSSSFIFLFAVLAAAALISFVVWETRIEKPAVDLSVLKNAGFTSGAVLGGILGLALFGSLFLLPLFMQELLGYDALQSGWAMMPRSLVMMMGMPIAGRLYNRMGPRLMVGLGLALSAASTFMLGRLNLDTSYMGLVLPQVWQGLAFSFIFVSLSTAALASVPARGSPMRRRCTT